MTNTLADTVPKTALSIWSKKYIVRFDISVGYFVFQINDSQQIELQT